LTNEGEDVVAAHHKQIHKDKKSYHKNLKKQKYQNASLGDLEYQYHSNAIENFYYYIFFSQ
jgi:hypothetical protein